MYKNEPTAPLSPPPPSIIDIPTLMDTVAIIVLGGKTRARKININVISVC